MCLVVMFLVSVSCSHVLVSVSCFHVLLMAVTVAINYINDCSCVRCLIFLSWCLVDIRG